jgi:hypothetical protein
MPELIEVGNKFIAERKERQPFTPEQREILMRSLVKKLTDEPARCWFVDSTELREVLGINFGVDRER